MKTLCLGGSFNPIHHGHLICARSVAETLGFERILLIPSGQPPHKPASGDLIDGSHRAHMCKLAARLDHSHLHSETHLSWDVSNMELTRTGPSYTLDTVRQLRQNGWATVPWLIGADMLNYLPKWHKYAELVQEAEFIVVSRPGVQIDWASLPDELAPLKNKVVAAPLIEISATTIRQRVRAGEPIDYLTPPAVVDYIMKQRLYA